MARCEAWHAERNRPCIFRLTPYSEPALDGFLENRGYELTDRTAVLQRSTRPEDAPGSAVEVMSAGLDEWLGAYVRMSGRAGAPPALRSVLRSMTAERLLAILWAGDPACAVACGMGVLQGELVALYDLATATSQRRKGYGSEMVRGLLAWGARNGARRAYLQVARTNRPAFRLYEKLGFEWVYDYWYRVRDGGDVEAETLRSDRG